ncbi:MAG: undecaprenyl-diphosphate phosphatase [Candidatus Acidiferrales bacterium]|jgi:undecaprenyl-diphosphatase
MSFWHVIVLAVVQGLAELLPVSSSAHVVVAEKLMGMDPSAPEMTLLLVMLHTGTMFAVIVYFWKQWVGTDFQSVDTFKAFAARVIVATGLTAVVGEGLVKLIERFAMRGTAHGEVEQLFGRLELIAPALAAAGVLILIAGIYEKRHPLTQSAAGALGMTQAALIGAVQGLCLPFRGFSRSGGTISTGLLAGVTKFRAETFSFALAVVLTPAVDAREVLRLIKAKHVVGGTALASAMIPSILGAFCAFLAGLLALKWLSKWLESDRWYVFGIYCLAAAVAVAVLHHAGY